MSDFTSQGGEVFPSIQSDEFRIHAIAEWPDKQLEEKVTEYWAFLNQGNVIPRALKASNRILAHLGFEVDYRAGFYAITEQDMSKLNDEVCGGAE